MHQSSSIVRVGLIVDSKTLTLEEELIADAIDRTPGVTVSHIFYQQFNKRKSFIGKLCFQLKKRGLRRTIDVCVWELLVRLETRLAASKIRMLHDKFKLTTEDRRFKAVEIVPDICKKGIFFSFKDSEIQKIEESGVELLIRCGSGILKGRILTCIRLGILSFHHGDNEWNRGCPAGFWEILQRKPETSFIIQRLTESLDGGVVFYRGSFQTKALYTLNSLYIRLRSIGFLGHAITKMLAEDATNKDSESSMDYLFDAKYRTIPCIAAQGSYIFYLLGLTVKNFLKKLLGRSWQLWEIRIVRQRGGTASLSKAITLTNPKRRFYADPFITTIRDKSYCFFEDFCLDSGRGVISCKCISDEGSKVETVLSEDFHLSYPFIFKAEEQIYMIPESSEVSEVRLYSCNEFPLRWELEKVLLTEVSAADTCCFFRDGFWWLLSNIDSSETGDHSSELHVFYSRDFLNQPFKPHPLNPVVHSYSHARNGGLIQRGNDIYRIAQSHKFLEYGHHLKIFKIILLSPFEYKEEFVRTVQPRFASGIKGIHHISSDGEFTAFDIRV